jgi:hypothetical protein
MREGRVSDAELLAQLAIRNGELLTERDSLKARLATLEKLAPAALWYLERSNTYPFFSAEMRAELERLDVPLIKAAEGEG